MNIKKMIPFLEEEEVAELARHILDGDEEYSDISLISLLPFMDSDDIDEMAVDFYRKEGNAAALLPFMSEDGVAALTAAMVENDDIDGIPSALPFMDDDDIDKLFLASVLKGDTCEDMYPFVSDDGWHEVLKYYKEGRIDFNFDEAYPFMDEDDIRDLFHFEMKKRSRKEETPVD